MNIKFSAEIRYSLLSEGTLVYVYVNKGPPYLANMDQAPTDLWRWIVNIISATGAIVGILGILVILFDLIGL